VLIFLIVFATGGYLLHMVDLRWHHEQHLLLDQVTNSQASAIERRLSHSLSATYILAQEVKRSGGQFQGFDKFAHEVIRTIGGVSNLQLAPEGIIKRIYPLKGNEKAIGHNLLIDDKRSKEANAAIKERHLTLAGPFELVQGGVAIIGRNPVFITEAERQKFWGFTSAVIFLEDLLSIAELDQLETKGYRYSISRVHPDNGNEEVFAGTSTHLGSSTSRVRVNIPNGYWTLTMSRDLNGHQINIIPGILGSFIIALIISAFAYRIFREPKRLKVLVEEKTKELEHLAFHDALTGLVNRQLLKEELEQEIRNIHRHGGHLAVMYLDLDDFKRINDSMGHEAGDRVLKSIAQRIKRVVSENDIVARLGGDEFAVLLLDLESHNDAMNIAEKITEEVAQPITLDQREALVSASVGITVFPEDSQNAEALMRNADLALYSSKKAGKNRYEFFNSKMQEDASRRLSIENELRQAIKNNEFFLVYQPVVSLESQQVLKLEALIRWNHPEKGLLAPDSFIDVAEQVGLIVPIGEWVLKEACQYIRNSNRGGSAKPIVAINISARQFSEKGFAKQVQKVLKDENIDPTQVEFEITETLVMDDIDHTVKVLNLLKEIGLRFSMDDFGTGYSSLAQLKQLPVSTLKIDRSFVCDLESGANDYQIVEAIVAMAHKLELDVVAEGIETEGQLNLIKQAGCDFGQGYFFGKPVTPDKLELGEALPSSSHKTL